jgi:hypothetical protein
VTPRLRTVGMLGLLTATLPVDLAVTAGALASTAVRRRPAPPATGRTVLLSGGKMTKTLALARAFHAAGHRVVLVETPRYRLTGHRFSRSVAAFHTVPDVTDEGYAEALLRIVKDEAVDVYVPVCSPLASYYDALAAERLAPFCEVVHADTALIELLDDKERFCTYAASLGLDAPEVHRVTDAEQVADFDFAAPERAGRSYVLKSIPYDPVHRLDLTRLPLLTREETLAFARSKPISPQTPWVLQEFVAGTEYCTHATARSGRVQVSCCCESSASQLNYEQVEKPAIEEWVRTFIAATGATGQLSFDFIETPAGRVLPIECNPRTHSAVTMLYDHPGVAAGYLEDGAPEVRPTAASRPTYWLYQEVWRLLTQARTPAEALERLRVLARGKDAVFDREDPLPFLLLHHLHLPSLLLGALVRGTDWVKIDVNIGKLVEPGGD